MTTLTEIIKSVLIGSFVARNSDIELMSKVWARQGFNMQRPAHNLIYAITYKMIAHPETIRRIRQKIQAEDPGLRGDNHLRRQSYQEIIRAASVRSADTLENALNK